MPVFSSPLQNAIVLDSRCRFQNAIVLDLEDLLPQKRPSLEPSSDARESSAAHPAPAARGLSENSRARKFLAALDEAAHGRDDNPAQAALLRELISSLWWGKLMLVPTNDVWHLDLDKHHEFAIAKLDQLIQLVVTIRKAWIDSPESAAARNVAERRLQELQGDLTEEKRDQYDWLKHEQELIKGMGKDTGRARTRRNLDLVQGSKLNNSRKRASTSFAFRPAGASSSSSLSCVSPRS